jgi:hypothetical protein
VSILSKDPIVLIGPGSEWFWTAVSGIVLAVTFLAIWRQLRQARSAAAFEQLSHLTEDWRSEGLLRARVRVARAFLVGEAPPPGPAGLIGDYWEGVASLVRGGHVDAVVVYESLGPSLRFSWALLQAETRRVQQEEGATTWVHFEWLAGLFDGLAARDGVPASIDRGAVIKHLPDLIASYEAQIRMAEESRMIPERGAPARRRSVAATASLEAPAAS